MKPTKPINIGYFVLFFFLLMMCLLRAEDEPAEISGRVFVNDSPTFSIKVTYWETNGIGHKTTRYFDTTGQLRLEEVEVFHVNSLDLMRFNLKDFKSGREEKFHKMQDKIVIRYKKNSQSDFKEAIKKQYPDLLRGSMIVLYIKKKIKEIEHDKKISFKLLVPKYLTTYGFLLKKKDETRIEGRSCYVIKMYPSSWFLRAIVKPTYFYIETNFPHRLLKYEGIITPKADNGKSFRGIATFTY
ncbi:MAG: hypothetical protein JSV88_04375 [Candidatus Aminicenantes bacterium]|nr:MAG: hypothetical protein JSV88_04375 [Candidatus Aminicenantes bacterium]